MYKMAQWKARAGTQVAHTIPKLPIERPGLALGGTEEALLATRGEERKLDKHGRPQDVWHYGCLRQGPWTRADGRKQQGLKLVSRQFRKQRLAVWAAGRGPDPSFTAMVFEACDRVLGPELTAGNSKVWS